MDKHAPEEVKRKLLEKFLDIEVEITREDPEPLIGGNSLKGPVLININTKNQFKQVKDFIFENRWVFWINGTALPNSPYTPTFNDPFITLKEN